MSHNNLKISNQSPDISGDYNISLSNLSNITASDTNDNILKFDGSNWIQAALLAQSYLSSGTAAGWSTYNAVGSAYSVNGSGVDSYRTHDLNSWSGRNSNSYFESGNITLNRGSHAGSTPTQTRFSRVELNANGKYLLIATTKVHLTSSSDYIEWQWLDLNTDAKLSPKWRQYGRSGGLSQGYCIGYASVTNNSRVCDIRCVARTGGSDGATSKADIIGAIQIG